jgi:hypothetical protein
MIDFFVWFKPIKDLPEFLKPKIIHGISNSVEMNIEFNYWFLKKNLISIVANL